MAHNHSQEHSQEKGIRRNEVLKNEEADLLLKKYREDHILLGNLQRMKMIHEAKIFSFSLSAFEESQLKHFSQIK